MFPKEFVFHVRQFQDSICPERKAIMITDINSENQFSSHYCLILDPNYLLYAKRDPLGKQVLVFDYMTLALTKNDQKIPLKRLPDLISKISQSFVDIQDQKARMYTKPAGGFSSVVQQSSRKSTSNELIPEPVGKGVFR